MSAGSFGFGDPEEEMRERAGAASGSGLGRMDDPESAAKERAGHGSVSKPAVDSPETAAKQSAGADERPTSPVKADEPEVSSEEAEGNATASGTVTDPTK